MLENFRLRVFREVARLGSFRRAAEVLYISQPAVTQQIKALEAETGQQLLDRSGGRVRLTAAGELLLAAADSSAALLERSLEQMAALAGQLRGTLAVAASTTLAQYVLPPLLAAFSRQHPGVDLTLQSANTGTVVTLVAEHQVALGLIEGPAHRADLLVEPWMADELVLAVPRTHPWAGEVLPPAALQAAPLLLREQGSGSRAVVEQALGAAGLDLAALRVVMQLGSTGALLACIEAGLGLGFVSRAALRGPRRLGTLATARIEGLRVLRTFSLVRQRGPSSGPAESFVGMLHDHVRERAQRRQARRTAASAQPDIDR